MSAEEHTKPRVLVAGATGYLGKYVVQALVARGHFVRVLTRSTERLESPGPFTAPAILRDSVDEVFVGEVTRPETLEGMLENIDCIFSSVGISRQRDGKSFEQVDYQANQNLIDASRASKVRRFVYVSMLGAEQIAHLAITRAHEKVVAELAASGLEHAIIRPSGYFSDMGVMLDMARRGRIFLVGEGTNRMNPIHGRDLAEVCVDAIESDEARMEIEVGGPEVLTQRDVAAIAFDVVGRSPKLTVIPVWLARGLARGIGLLSTQFGDLAEFIVTAGDVDAVASHKTGMPIRQYFEELEREHD